MKKVLIASFDMEIGGVERSLISMLNKFDYDKYVVDLMLYKHQGDLMYLINEKVSLLAEISSYTTFRKSIVQTIKDRQYLIGLARVLSRLNADIAGRLKKINEPGYYQMQLIWKYTLPLLPKLGNVYDIAISYLWPHYFVAHKVEAKTKVAWIHTDYSTITTNISMDLKMWEKFDHIVAVSEECKKAFLKKYGELEDKVTVIENIISPEFIINMAHQEMDNPMVADNRFKLATVARLSHAKGIDNAVKAMKVLKDRGYHNIVWYVIGYGGEEDLIRDLISKNGLEDSFILLGKQINPYPFIAACDLYVQPSRYEGKAVTVTEAQILGKPVLITKYPTAGSQLIDGEDGIICESSVIGLAEGIMGLYNDQELRLRLNNNVTTKNYSNESQLNYLYELIG